MLSASLLAILLFDHSKSWVPDFVDGTASGFAKKETRLWIQAWTDTKIPIYDGESDINPEGEFIFGADATPGGTKGYFVRVHLDSYLSRAFYVPVPRRGRPHFEFNRMQFVFGDVNNDNVIDKQDVAWAEEALGKTKLDHHWDVPDLSPYNDHSAKFYDFNYDSKVDEEDIRLIRMNLGKRGE